jgi:hypothetical protein
MRIRENVRLLLEFTHLLQKYRYARYRLPHWPKVKALRWYRALQIEKTAPVSTAPVNGDGLNVLYVTGPRQVTDLLYSAKSVAANLARPFSMTVYGDKHLGPVDADRIARHFPHADVWTKARRDEVVLPDLAKADLHRCIEFREKLPMAAKIIDAKLLLSGDAFVLLDTDTVALRPLSIFEDMVEKADGCIFGKDADNAYVFPYEELESRFRVRVVPQINTGLFYVRKEILDLQQVEEWLSMPGFDMSNGWAEQTIIAALASKGTVRYFPEDRYDMGSRSHTFAREFVHYCGMKPGPVEVEMLRVGQGAALRAMEHE